MLTTATYRRITPSVLDGSFASMPGRVVSITNARNCPTSGTPASANVSEKNVSRGATTIGRIANVNTESADVSWCVAVPWSTACAKRDMTSGRMEAGSMYARSRAEEAAAKRSEATLLYMPLSTRRRIAAAKRARAKDVGFFLETFLPAPFSSLASAASAAATLFLKYFTACVRNCASVFVQRPALEGCA